MYKLGYLSGCVSTYESIFVLWTYFYDSSYAGGHKVTKLLCLQVNALFFGWYYAIKITKNTF
jgi:hypothetical protein